VRLEDDLLKFSMLESVKFARCAEMHVEIVSVADRRGDN
jgi:hypothetical protein